MNTLRTRPLVGVDLGGTQVRAGRVQGSRLIKLNVRAARGAGDKSEVLEDVFAAIDAVFDRKVVGIGVGVPSLVKVHAGTVYDTTNIPSWKAFPLKTHLEKRYGVPIRINNDANCFALGELHFGVGRGCANLVGLVLGTGLGAGIVSKGALHSGIDCAAGEFGMIPYRDSILEHYTSGQFFQRHGWRGVDAAREARAGNVDARKLFESYGKHLAHAIQIILYALAPETIVLGGSVSQSYALFRPSLHEALKRYAFPRVLKQVQVKTSRIREVATLGAASLVLGVT